jgi:1-phosphofructokinase family hexose kinase
MRFVTLTVNPSIDWHLRVESLSRGEIACARKETSYPGGKGVNVSRILHSLGGDTLALCTAGGISGHELVELMKRESLPHEIVPIKGVTRRNLLIEENDGRRIKINTVGPRIGMDEAQKIFELVMASVSTDSVLFLCGSLPPGMVSDFYRSIMAGVKNSRILTALDTSGPALVEGIGMSPGVIKMNLRELSFYLGRAVTSLDEASRAGELWELAASSELLISGGAEGAMIYGGGKRWGGSSQKKAPSMAVGAGDALLGGYVMKRSQGASLPDSLAFALALATATALAPAHELAGEAATYRNEISLSML